MDQAPPKKMAPGDDMHLTLLMAPHNLNLVTGQDRQHLLAFGRAAFEAGQKCQGCSVPQNGLHQIAEPSHSMSQYASKDDMLKAVMAENEGLKAQLAAAQQWAQDRLDRLYLALEVCSAELFAQCADQGRAMKYVDQARSALAAEQCARAAQAKQGERKP